MHKKYFKIGKNTFFMLSGFCSELPRLIKKSIFILRKKGLWSVYDEFKNYVRFKILTAKHKNKCKDFLFISGCYLEMPQKYRCEFQKEQLEKNGLSGDLRFFTEISDEWLKYYDVFIIYRAPITEQLEQFIKKAKQLNKLVIFDIDDLVFDEELVKDKHEVKEMSKDERDVYFDGIGRHKKTMELCDHGIASTETIAKHMRKYIPNILVNRNSVSDDLVIRSQEAWAMEKMPELKDKIVLGYFSGSKTHDDDLKLIENVLMKCFEKYPNIVLFLVGPLKLSKKLSKCRDRIIRNDFVEYEKLPNLIAQVDINLAPLVTNEFNNGKSELKYTEAALVKKPTIASATEAFEYAIIDGKTGFIANNEKEWLNKLTLLIEDKSLRIKVAESAYCDVKKKHNTKTLGKNLLSFINKNRKKKIVYISPSTKISGGVMVVGQHLQRLQARGYNVALVAQDNKDNLGWLKDFKAPVIPYISFQRSNLKLLDVAIATLWSTLSAVKKSSAVKKYYLVQNKEHFFYKKESSNFKKAKKTYSENTNFLTVSKWCQRWLCEEFGKTARYIPNGIDRRVFRRVEPIEYKSSNKTRILIEGNPDDDYKNVDESFKIVKKLNKDKFEIWFISYGGRPKKWYYYDKFFQRVPYNDMPKYYSACDILLKTSRLESFSYLPLEMMACEGVCVVAENGGNREYVKNNYNALTYKLGDIDTAVKNIEKLANDKQLREELIINGLQTVKGRDWNKSINILESILNNNN